MKEEEKMEEEESEGLSILQARKVWSQEEFFLSLSLSLSLSRLSPSARRRSIL